ncbi:MAG: AMP-binding protein [Treponema sp.]|nr:AMP-binding protein [Treponema sp.]
MGKYTKIIKENISAIIKSGKTLKDVYTVMFSHSDLIAYERLVDFEVDAVTYAAYDLEIRAFAAYLKHIYPNEKSGFIGIDLGNTPNFLIAFWGVLMSGSKPYLINSFYPSELKIKLLNKLNVKIVITSAADYIDFTIVNIDVFDKKCPRIADDYWQNEFAISSTLTGLEAKICVFDGEAVVNQILKTPNIIKTNNWLISDYQKRIKVAMILPLFHIFGIMVSYFWFAFFGQTMVFLKDSSPDTIRGTINRHKVTHIFAPPILFHKLYKGIMNGILQESKKRKNDFKLGIKFAFFLQNIFPLLGVMVSRRLFKDVLVASFGMSPRFMISGGAHIDSEAHKIINCIGYPLFNGYGTTETAITGANFSLKISKRTNGSIGNPFKNITYTYDEDETLIVSSDSNCKRIISLDSLPPNTNSINEEESAGHCIKTNDLVKIINGRLFVVGRKSDLYVGENGENISPDTIQNNLNVKSANRFCVLEIDKKLSVVLEYNNNIPCEIIHNEIEYIKNTLANISNGHYVNDIFITYEPISSLNAIKVSRALLRKKIDEGDVILNDYRKLKINENAQKNVHDDKTMSVIKQSFKKAADTDADIQSNDDFFLDLGGDSLDYFSLICELESIFNIKFNLEKNKSLRTPDKFYEYLKELL